LDQIVLENHKLYLKRIELYQSFGYDLEKERVFILDKSLPVSGNILEIGTGKGHFSLALAKGGFSFTSIDISRQEQAIARLNLRYFGLENHADFRIEDAEGLSFPDHSFDIIFSINVFHHLESPSKVLDEMIRLLRPTGKLVLSDFTQKGLDMVNRCHRQEGRIHDYFKNGLEQAKDLFMYKGFNIKEAQSNAQSVLIAEGNKG
jgi:ubiquinone/menaquinone biosynthesis C-methylase UbiE